jgi:adenylate cyclase
MPGGDDATALAVAAFVIALDEHDATMALKLFDQALTLSSSNIFALTGSAVTLAWMGNTEKNIERAKQALRFSPFDSLNFRANSAMSIAHFYSGRYAENPRYSSRFRMHGVSLACRSNHEVRKTLSVVMKLSALALS